MALLSPYWVLDFSFLLCGVICYFYAKFKLKSRKHWANRNIPYEEPFFIFGNTKDANYKKRIGQIIDELYFKHKNKNLLGIWIYTRPALVVNDVELMKNILVKDFPHFHDRGLTINEELEPLTAHLFNMSGQQWRNLRVKLTPTFTSGKMKMMYDTIYDVGLQLQAFLEKPAAEEATLEIKDLLARFTTDVISSCAFGVEAHALEDPNSEFRKYGRMVFELPLINIISSILQFVVPELSKFVTLRQMPKEVSDFFMKAVKDVVTYRETTNQRRKDFMELLIELKNKGRIEDVDNKFVGRTTTLGDGDPFTLEQAAAQAFVFFFAGFETSSTTLMLILYELARNGDIQKKLQHEIDSVLEKEGSKISYNALQNMAYLDQVVQESLRMYPPVPLLFRECTKQYQIPGTEAVLEKGDFLLIPVAAVQSDPEHFPHPERFNPDRFSAEAKSSRDSFLNLSFGGGPRVCIGARFGILQVKVGLAVILSKYNVSVASSTPIPINFDPKVFVPTPKNGMPLKISKR